MENKIIEELFNNIYENSNRLKSLIDLIDKAHKTTNGVELDRYIFDMVTKLVNDINCELCIFETKI